MNQHIQTSLGPSSVSDWATCQLRRFAVLMLLANIAVPAAMFGYAALSGEDYWRMFRGENHAANWFSSLQMILIAIAAFANYQLAGVARRVGSARVASHRAMWAVFALGFVVLALDEQFNLHEALRDGVFRPAGVFTDSSWIISGDVGLYLFFFIGIACSVFLRDDLRRARHAMPLFIAALVLAFPTIVIDSLRDSAMASWPLRRFLDYTFEEVGEIWAQLLFMLAFLRVLAWRFEGMRVENGNRP